MTMPVAAQTNSISFRNEVMAVLSRAGCNAGACHGNANGKAGFKLSLRGQDPDLDFIALTRDQFGRRISLLEPEQSLILLKPTTTLAHEGGKRFPPGSPEYEIVRHWIADGATNDLASAPKLERIVVSPGEKILIEPAVEIQIRAEAIFSDGTRRDVTRLAVYETANGIAKASADGLVRREQTGETTVLVRYLQCQEPVRLAFVPARPDFRPAKIPASNFIDEHIFAKLRQLRMNPSPLCADEIFLRRAYLDLLGLLPTADEARKFVADRRRDKRARVIEQLLERPEFADNWALKWADLLRVEERTLDAKGTAAFHHWIRQSIADKKPLDQFVRELITARGSTYLNPAANFYRANRDAVTRSEAIAQVFLGTRLQCAQCHNHPFDRWTQADYFDWAAVFAKVQYKILENRRTDSNDSHEFKGEQIVYVARKGEVKNPRTQRPAEPRFLGNTPSAANQITGDKFSRAPFVVGQASRLSSGARQLDGSPDRRDASPTTEPDELATFAAWMTAPTNAFFARAQVNRIWFQLMGRGIVDPIDDFRATNPASHPALLDALAADFVKHQFDLRHTIRLIMSSRAYQLSSEPNDTNRDDEMNYSHALVRRLAAEQLLDCETQVAGVPTQFRGYPAGLRATQLPGAHTERRRGEKIGTADLFLEIFGKPQRLLTCECERSAETTMGQAFQMISGPSVNELLTQPDNRLARLLASGQPDAALINELYWTALTRAPSSAEAAKATAHLEKAKDRRAALEDVAWGLLNAKEFVLRR